MPTPYHKQNLMVPGRRYTLGDAAAAGLLVSVRCNLCSRPGTVFYATDLIQVLDPERDAYAAPFPCVRCKSEEYVRVKLRSPEDSDVGRLKVRRLIGIRKTPLWRNKLVGD